MPNHVINKLTFTCSEERLLQILNEICYDKREGSEYGIGTFDFNKIKPMPESLNIESGSTTTESINLYLTALNPAGPDLGLEKLSPDEFDKLLEEYQGDSRYKAYNASLTAEEIGKFTKYRDLTDLLTLGEAAVNNRIRYGAITWYEWCSSEENWNTKWNSYDSGAYFGGDTISFETAWSAPHPVIKALSEKYPEVHILHQWADEDLGRNCGWMEYENGEERDCNFFDDDRESLAFAEELWGYEPEEPELMFEVRPATKAEQMYTYTQSTQIQGQTGCIGHLRGDMDSDGKGFFTSWDDHRGYLKTDEFKAEFDIVINSLRFDSAYGDILKDRTSLAKYCYSHPEARMDGPDENYGFRADTGSYSYLFRLNPNKGNYNLYCYCYKKDWLDQHLKQAERGIRFIDPNYNNLFRIPDGGKIRITYRDGEQRECVCRYIDEYHLEVGGGSCNLFHICELAERMEQNGNKIEPIDRMPEREKKTRQKERER